MTFDRDEIGRKVIETTQICAEGYRRGDPSLSNADRETNEKCAIAASNAGWFILHGLGFSNEEIQALADAYRKDAS